MTRAPDAPALADAPQVNGKRARTKAQNRAAILAAARGVFVEQGYGAASVRDIVRRTDLASGTFYNYFPDKESVFLALADEALAATRIRVRAARAAAASLDALVEDGYRAFFTSVAEDPVAFELVRRNAEAMRALAHSPIAAAGVQDLLEDLRDALAEEGGPPLDVEYLAAAMAGVAFEVAGRMVDRDPVDVEGATAFATALFLGGMARLARVG